MDFDIKFVGDCAANIVFGDTICKEINQKVCAFQKALERENIEGILETVPAYCSLMVHYDPERILWNELRYRLQYVGKRLTADSLQPGTIWEIPVVYGGEYGPDLDFIAQSHGILPEEVIKIHTSGTYLVYMLGFLPGFPYLGGMEARIAVPRLETPRVSIPAGSVGIAGSQTGIYPLSSPGGWRLIGRTPVRLFAPERENPFLIQAGDSIRFTEIDLKTYGAIAAQEHTGTYRHRKRSEQGAEL